MQTFDIFALPPAVSCRLIDFETARIRTRRDGGPTLVVEGERPCRDMEVHLIPAVYDRRPRYWRVEVVGSLSRPCLEPGERYAARATLMSLVGSKGIEVTGASRTVRLEASGSYGTPPGAHAGDSIRSSA